MAPISEPCVDSRNGFWSCQAPSGTLRNPDNLVSVYRTWLKEA